MYFTLFSLISAFHLLHNPLHVVRKTP